jgi:hypothetical protein
MKIGGYDVVTSNLTDNDSIQRKQHGRRYDDNQREAGSIRHNCRSSSCMPWYRPARPLRKRSSAPAKATMSAKVTTTIADAYPTS